MDAKALLGVVGVLELREVQDATFLKDLGKDLDEEGPIKVTRDNWEDQNGKPRGCFMVDSVDEANVRKIFPKDKLPTGVELVPQQGGGTAGEHLLFMALGAPVITNDVIQSARPLKDPMSTPTTLIKLTAEGAKKLEEVTERIKGKKLAIVLDGKITSTPVVMGVLSGGDVQIPQPDVGDRQEREKNASLLAAAIDAGALPGPMTLSEERPVSGR
jgi:preprotein translocase subunit SecD